MGFRGSPGPLGPLSLPPRPSGSPGSQVLYLASLPLPLARSLLPSSTPGGSPYTTPGGQSYVCATSNAEFVREFDPLNAYYYKHVTLCRHGGTLVWLFGLICSTGREYPMMTMTGGAFNKKMHRESVMCSLFLGAPIDSC